MVNDGRKIYCFLGLPASGKGTQVDILAKKIKAEAFGVGDLIRREIESADLSDPFYKKMKEDYDKGNPQPDSIAIDLVRKCIKNSTGTIILDNFPFSTKQADMFFEVCLELSISIPCLIIVNISKEEALTRATKRKVCSSCSSVYIGKGENICPKCGGALITRADDNEATIARRIDEYLPRIDEVRMVFADKGVVLEINGEQSINKVACEIALKLSKV
jgi:adenylate kinase